MKGLKVVVGLLAIAGVAASAALAGLGPYGGWSAAVRVKGSETSEPSFNGTDLDGCPFISRDGKRFFMASNRLTGPGDSVKDLNIWTSTRESESAPWGAPVLVGEPVSIDTLTGTPPIDDFCPTLARNGHDFFFVSNRNGYCGSESGAPRNADIYSTRWRGGSGGFDPADRLGCDVNTNANEASPFPLPQDGDGPVLYFSTTLNDGGDLYFSRWVDGSFRGRTAVPGVNTAFIEGQPNVRRDGLEIFFFSNRPGAAGNDIYSASRASTADAWSTAVNLGPNVNSSAAETRPSLSWDGTTLYFGSTRAGGEGSTDHYVTTRSIAP